ncbi:MAG: DUF427 domain-containing protein [Woeseiaceae bacterium]|nr:DUF427 domain-containing protein [Woeseiaceae bacterium]
MWKFTGKERPSFAEEPGPGKESVWDYPRPPDVVADARRVEVRAGDLLIANTTQAQRLRETASPPAWYLPTSDVAMNRLVDAPDRSFCEWKGVARYLALETGGEAIAWTYDDPGARYAMLKDHVAFYPGRIECYVDGERVRAQPGGFYGGWITADIVGPYKGDPGTGHW